MGWSEPVTRFYEKEILRLAQQLVAEQAKDKGLWAIPRTGSEARLQQELRRLHLIIEGDLTQETIDGLE